MKKILTKYKLFINLRLLALVMFTWCGMATTCYSQDSGNNPGNSIAAYGQNPEVKKEKNCGNMKMDTALLNQVIQYELLNSTSRLTSTDYVIRVFFHICRNDNRTNSAATQSQIESEFSDLATDFSGNNMCFINMGINYIDNTQINTNLDVDDPGNVAWLNPFLEPGCLNIFYHRDLPGVGGSAYDIPNNFCSIDNSRIGDHTISHEVGHCFGLLHTFESAHGFERISGFNSDDTGDKIEDTPADPRAYEDEPCYSVDNCCYTGSCLDPDFLPFFNPPYNNIMSYWGTNYGYTNLEFTSGQFSRVGAFLIFAPILQDCISPTDLTIGPVNYSSGQRLLTALNAITTSGTVNLSSSANTTIISGTSVRLLPGFRAYPSTGMLIVGTRPSSCGSGAIRNSPDINHGDEKEEFAGEFKCYPNLFSDMITFEFNLPGDDEVSIRVYDLMGKEVRAFTKSFYARGKYEIMAGASDLPQGIYLAVLQGKLLRKEQKIIKSN